MQKQDNFNPLVSVIVPIYGIERYVGFCIESIIKQTYKNLEIILVDDGSPDRCPEICDLYAKKDKRIKVIHKQNGGLVSARKAGIKLASGDYSTYVDGDDWIKEDYIEWMVKEIGKSDFVCSGFDRSIFNKMVPIKNNFPAGIYEGEGLDSIRSNMMSLDGSFKIGLSTYVWNKLFKTNLLRKHQIMVDDSISIGEDAAVVYPLVMDCKKITITDNTGYVYRQREDSMLKRNKPFNAELKCLNVLYSYLNRSLLKNNLKDKYNIKNQIDTFVLGLAVIRSGFGGDGLDEFIFGKSIKNKRVAVVSAGTFGQQMYSRLQESNYCANLCWIDDDYWEYRRNCYDVDSLSSIKEKDFDYAIVASLDFETTDRFIKELNANSVNDSKILTVKITEIGKNKLLNSYFGFEG